MWARFIDELRAEHPGAVAPGGGSGSVRATLQQAHEEVAARRAQQSG